MNNKSLVFTEKTIGRHTKRLQKELAKINHDLKLSEAQNMLSRILGMKDYHELKQVLKFEDKEENINNELFIRSTLIPEHYKQHHITQKKENMLKYVLLDELEVIKHKIPLNIIKLIDLIITSNKSEVKDFISNNEVDLNYQIPERDWQPKTILDFAIFFEQYDILKYLISLRHIDKINSQEYLITIEAGRNNIDLFKYLCSVLPYNQYTLDLALMYATNKNSLEHVQYLLTNKELKFNSNIHFRNDQCLKNAIVNGNLNIVKYLLTSENLIEKPSLFSVSFRNNKHDLRNEVIHKLKLYSGEIKDSDGVAFNFEQLEIDNFFSCLNYLIKDYGDKDFVHWLYLKKELRPYIQKNEIDLDYILNLIE